MIFLRSFTQMLSTFTFPGRIIASRYMFVSELFRSCFSESSCMSCENKVIDMVKIHAVNIYRMLIAVGIIDQYEHLNRFIFRFIFSNTFTLAILHREALNGVNVIKIK